MIVNNDMILVLVMMIILVVIYCNVIVVILNAFLPYLFVQEAEEKSKEIVNYWHPNLTINMMDDQTPWTPGAVPPPMDECKQYINM